MAGRPTKEPGEKMEIPLRIMLTPTQVEAIRRAAKEAGTDVSAWARPVLLDAAKAKWIVVSVAGREAQVQLTPTLDGRWHISKHLNPSPSRMRNNKKIAEMLFATFPSTAKAADHVANLIRKGVITPGEGQHGGMNIKRFDFTE